VVIKSFKKVIIQVLLQVFRRDFLIFLEEKKEEAEIRQLIEYSAYFLWQNLFFLIISDSLAIILVGFGSDFYGF